MICSCQQRTCEQAVIFVVGACMEDCGQPLMLQMMVETCQSTLRAVLATFFYFPFLRRKKQVFARKTFYLQRWNVHAHVFTYCMIECLLMYELHGRERRLLMWKKRKTYCIPWISWMNNELNSDVLSHWTWAAHRDRHKVGWDKLSSLYLQCRAATRDVNGWQLIS